MLLLADESVDFNIVQHLRGQGFEVIAIIETTPGIVDEAVLDKANALNAILITEDKDSGELTFRLRLPNRGIILIRMDGEPLDVKMQQLGQLIEVYGDRLQDSFSVVTSRKIRVISRPSTRP